MTDIVKLPIDSDAILMKRLQSTCDLRWAAGYALVSIIVVSSEIILFFQPRPPVPTSPPDNAPSPA